MRRSMDVSAALVRCALACSVFILMAGALSVSGAYEKMPQWASLLVQAALTLLCFGLTAWRGLFCCDGDQSEKLCCRALEPEQTVCLSLTGVLLVCPLTLMGDLLFAPLLRMGFVQKAGAAAPFALFLPMVIKSAVLVPVCEELFFRGYLFAALRESGSRYAAVLTSLFFALAHGVDAMLLPRFAMGLLLCMLMLRTDSLLAGVLVHAAYNLTILMLSFAGAGALFSGLGFASCLLRLLGCAAFVWMLKRAYGAPLAPGMLKWGRAMTSGQVLLVCVSLAAAVYVPLLLYVL